MIRSILLCLAITACGGKQSSPQQPPQGPASGSAAEPAHEHAEAEEGMPELLKPFHDELAPRWHAAPGAARMSDMCGAIAKLDAESVKLAQQASPSGADERAWTIETTRLVGSVVELEDTCKATNLAAFDPAFARVHDSFHAVLGVAMGHATK